MVMHTGVALFFLSAYYIDADNHYCYVFNIGVATMPLEPPIPAETPGRVSTRTYTNEASRLRKDVLHGPASLDFASDTIVPECVHPLFPMVGEPERLPLPTDVSSATVANKRNIEQTYCTCAPDKCVSDVAGKSTCRGSGCVWMLKWGLQWVLESAEMGMFEWGCPRKLIHLKINFVSKEYAVQPSMSAK